MRLIQVECNLISNPITEVIANEPMVRIGAEAVSSLARAAVAKAVVTRATHATFCISIVDMGGPATIPPTSGVDEGPDQQPHHRPS